MNLSYQLPDELIVKTIELAPEMVVVTDSAGLIRYVNPSFTRVTGFTADEAIGKPMSILKSGYVNDSYYSELWTALLRKKEWHGVFINRRKDGSIYPDQQSVTPVSDEKNSATYFVAVKRDICEPFSMSGKESLKDHAVPFPFSSEILRKTLGCLHDATVITDLEGFPLYLSPTFLRLSGYTPYDILSDPKSIIVSEEHTESYKTSVWETLRAGKPWTGPLNHRKKDGSVYSTQTGIVPLRNTQGAVEHFVCIKRDISASQLIRLELARSRKEVAGLYERLDFLLEQTGGFLYFHDQWGFLQYVSPSVEKVLGVIPEVYLTNYTDYLTDSEINKTVVDFTNNALATGEPSPPYLAEMYNVEREPVIIEVHETPVKEEGKVTGVLGLARDVTEKIRTQEILSQAQKLESLGQLAAGVAHEINTPMQFIGHNTDFVAKTIKKFEGFLQTLEDEISKEGLSAERKVANLRLALTNLQTAFGQKDIFRETSQAISESLEGVNRIGEIIRSMQLASYGETEDFFSEDIHRLINSATTLTRNYWKNVCAIKIVPDLSVPPVKVSPGLLTQAFTNLILNAIDAIKEKPEFQSPRQQGEITIFTRLTGNSVTISFRDNGCGIPKANYSRLFDMFFTTKAPGEGTGQGLPFVRDVVNNKHKGEVTFESVEGKGTTFSLRLPLDPHVSRSEE